MNSPTASEKSASARVSARATNEPLAPNTLKNFLIFTPSYNELIGGSIVLHKLCHLINRTGREAYITPYFRTFELNRRNVIDAFSDFAKEMYRSLRFAFRTNPSFNTPVIMHPDDIKDWNDWILVYPETVFGNPLGATNVVRWLLHNPGFHTGCIYYRRNELYFRYDSHIKPFHFPGSTTSPNVLKVIHYPLEYYNAEKTATERHGTAYAIRKGKGKRIQHDLRDSILIDGKSHKQVATIFKSVKTFISYDVYTAYSIFAALCGCDSVIIPDDGVDEESWSPNPKSRYGLAYGFENIAKARTTKHLLRERLLREESGTMANVAAFVNEVDSFFRGDVLFQHGSRERPSSSL